MKEKPAPEWLRTKEGSCDTRGKAFGWTLTGGLHQDDNLSTFSAARVAPLGEGMSRLLPFPTSMEQGCSVHGLATQTVPGPFCHTLVSRHVPIHSQELHQDWLPPLSEETDWSQSSSNCLCTSPMSWVRTISHVSVGNPMFYPEP